MSKNKPQREKKKKSSSISEMSCEKISNDTLVENQCNSKKNKLFESKKETIKIKAKRIKEKCAIVKQNSSSSLNGCKGDKSMRKTFPIQNEPGTSTNSNSESETSSTVLKKKRGRRGNKKKNQDEKFSPLAIDILSKKLILNAETLFILNLLYTDSKERDKLIFDMAVAKNILIFDKDTNSYAVHQRVKDLIPHILLVGNVRCREYRQSTYDKLEKIKKDNKMKKNNEKKITQAENPNGIRETNKCKYFEDLVNEIVLEGISDDKKAQFTFNYKNNDDHQKAENYYNNPDFIDSLENYVQKCVDANLGMVIEGEIRINERNNYHAFMRNVDGKRDAFIPSRLARKYALEGDIVRAFVRNVERSTPVVTPLLNTTTGSDDCIIEDDCREIGQEETDLGIISENITEQNYVAFVIKVIKNVHNRKCVGTFMTPHPKLRYITFVPRDLKMQTIRIYRNSMPPELSKNNNESIGETLYEVKINNFSNDLCIGTILHSIGNCGELDSENKAILLQNDIHIEPYDEKFNEMYRTPLIITEKDLAQREDIREQCVFTIDPFTARDLDDAVSCRKLSEDTYEIGVHISDVSHFIPENSELDNIIKERTTSIYMVNEVFHMLPKPLCFKCSLLPGEDKFTFSVFWNMTTEGEILSTRFTRTIMRSCTQLAYEHAQRVIDNPTQIFDESDFPEIKNGFTTDDIVTTIKILQKIASNLRMKRFDNGALRMDRTKLYFELNSETGEPINYSPVCLDTANFLIEEFMLLANQTTAQFIYDKYPVNAVLRNHQPPLPNLIKKLREELLNLNINLDITSSKSIFNDMEKICKESKQPEVMQVCLSNLISKTMSRARYFCSDEAEGCEYLSHYALSIPIYTHFTSPIRRYPDILVHRLLSAALDYSELPKRSTDELQEICGVCNEMKYRAKIAGEQSSDLYFLHYVKSKVKIIMPAAILFIGRSAMNIISIRTGHQFKITFKCVKGKGFKCFVDTSKTPLVAYIIDNTDQNKKITLNVFSVIDITLQVNKLKLTASMVNPFLCENNEGGG